MAGDDHIDVLDRRSCFRKCLPVLDGAAAIVRIDDRSAFVGKCIAGMQRSNGRKHDPGVAIRVSAAKVIKVDFIFAFTER